MIKCSVSLNIECLSTCKNIFQSLLLLNQTIPLIQFYSGDISKHMHMPSHSHKHQHQHHHWQYDHQHHRHSHAHLCGQVRSVLSLEQDGRLGNGHRALLVPVRGDGAPHLHVTTELRQLAGSQLKGEAK